MFPGSGVTDGDIYRISLTPQKSRLSTIADQHDSPYFVPSCPAFNVIVVV